MSVIREREYIINVTKINIWGNLSRKQTIILCTIVEIVVPLK